MADKEAVMRLLEERQQAGLESGEPDDLREEWLRAVGSLLRRIRGWLADAESRRLLHVEQDTATIEEERLGTYSAPMLHVQTPGVSVRIVPSARIVIGARGRVDFETPASRVMLLRTADQKWEFREPSPSGWRVMPLDEGSFWTVMDSLLR